MLIWSNVKLAIDLSALFYSRRGVARYIRCLLYHLKQLPEIERIDEVGFKIANFDYQQPARAIKTGLREFIWEPIILPVTLSRSNVDLVHATCNPCIGVPRRIPKIVTMHDLEMFYTPDRFRWWTRMRSPLDAAGYRRADRLICVSENTANDAMRLLEISHKKIDVVPLGCHLNPASPERRPTTLTPTDDFFLFVSALEPGKNLQLLNQAYHLAESKGIHLPPLFIVGERVHGVAGEGPCPPSWKFLGRIEDDELVYLYRRARCLLVPSRYEGFGLPVLEGMNMGIPVICSPLSSLPEVGGDAPIYADQTPEDYLRAMMDVLKDSQMVAEHVARGRERASLFSWARCAKETSVAYEKALR